MLFRKIERRGPADHWPGITRRDSSQSANGSLRDHPRVAVSRYQRMNCVGASFDVAGAHFGKRGAQPIDSASPILPRLNRGPLTQLRILILGEPENRGPRPMRAGAAESGLTTHLRSFATARGQVDDTHQQRHHPSEGGRA